MLFSTAARPTTDKTTIKFTTCKYYVRNMTASQFGVWVIRLRNSCYFFNQFRYGINAFIDCEKCKFWTLLPIRAILPYFCAANCPMKKNFYNRPNHIHSFIHEHNFIERHLYLFNINIVLCKLESWKARWQNVSFISFFFTLDVFRKFYWIVMESMNSNFRPLQRWYW